MAFGKGFVEGIYDNISGLMSNGPTALSMTQKMTRIMLGENPIDVFINSTAIKNNLVAMYDDIHSTNPELKGYGWGNITFFGATAALPGGLVEDVDKIGFQSFVNFEAVNHINGLRLQRALMIEQAKSIFTETGELTPEAIQNSLLVKSGEELGNLLLRNELLREVEI